MSATMHLVCLKDTGHVLAALAATTAGSTPTLDAAVGTDLPIAAVRSTENGSDGLRFVRTKIPASLLELKSVPLDERVIAAPMRHAVDGGRVVRLPPFTALPPAPELTASTVKLEDGTLDTHAVVIVARTGDPTDQHRVQTGEFVDADGDEVVDDLVLPLRILPGDTCAWIDDPGEYDIFVAVGGRRPYWHTAVAVP